MLESYSERELQLSFTSCATLAAIGCKIQDTELLTPIEKHLLIKQKTVIHSPVNKIKDALIAMLCGANGLVEVNTKLRPDGALQLCFGRDGCADQSTIQVTLNSCSSRNVGQMMNAVNEIFCNHSLSAKHPFGKKMLVLDVDTTGLPCGKSYDAALKGYQPTHGTSMIRYGRQLCRVLAAQYEEIVIDRIYPGNVYLNHTLPWVIDESENLLKLKKLKRERTVIRMDSGGFSHLELLLSKGYQIHCKEHLPKRAKEFALRVKKWVEDPNNPGRFLGFFPYDMGDYIKPTKRIIIKWTRQKTNELKYASIVSSLQPDDLLNLLPEALNYSNDNSSDLVLAYAKFYDLRAGTIEIEFKEDKQGLGMTKRSKKRYEAQQMVMLLNNLAHNILVWEKNRLSELIPSLQKYGLMRFRRDILQIPGFIEVTDTNKVAKIILNNKAPFSNDLAIALTKILFRTNIVVSVGQI